MKSLICEEINGVSRKSESKKKKENIMDKKFEIRFAKLEEKIPDDLHAKIAELANKQAEEQDYSKKSFVVWSQIIATLSIALVGGLFTLSNSKQQEKNNKVMM